MLDLIFSVCAIVGAGAAIVIGLTLLAISLDKIEV
jgi:hypothetical protein